MKKQRQKVYLVEDVYENPGRIYAVFANEEDANDFAESLEREVDCEVVPRTLFWGQPPVRGYND